MANTDLLPGGYLLEEEHYVEAFRRSLQPGDEEGGDELLLQFYARQGGCRTVRAKDIIDW